MAELKIRGGEPDTDPASAEVGPDAPADAAPPAGGPAGRSRWTILMAGLTLAFVLLAAVDVVLLIAGNDPSAKQRGPALDVAKRVVLDLAALDSADRETRLAQLLDSTTGPLRDQLDGYAGNLHIVSEEGETRSDLTIGAAALERIDERSAVALITAATTVRTPEVADGQPLRHRLAVELHRERGRWLASSVEFVP